MRNLILHLKAAWLFYRIDPYINVSDWTSDDATMLSRFLTTGTGVKWKRFHSNRVNRSQINATLKPSTAFDAGYAAGCRGTAAFNDSLLNISLPTDEQLEDGPEETGNALEVDRISS